jgi:hypothetical protein
MTGKLHFVRIYGKPGFAVISDSFISCWVCVTHCIVFINVTNCFVNYFPKKWNMFSNYLPILPSHGRIGFWETNNYSLFGFFFFKERECFVKFYPLHKSQEKKKCHQWWMHSFWTGGIQGRVGSKMGTQTIFFFNFAPIRNMWLKIYISFSLSHLRSFRFTDIKSH